MVLADIFGPDLLIVVLVVVVLIFGGAAIPKLARNLGSAQSEFKKGLGDHKDEKSDASSNASTNGDNRAESTRVETTRVETSKAEDSGSQSGA